MPLRNLGETPKSQPGVVGDIADVPILSSPDKNNSALENSDNVVDCVLDKDFSGTFHAEVD